MPTETPLRSIRTELKWQSAINNDRAFSNRELFLMSFDIMRLRADVENSSYKDTNIMLDGDGHDFIDLTFSEDNSDMFRARKISVDYVHSLGHQEVLELTHLRPQTRRGRQVYTAGWKPTQFRSGFFGSIMDLTGIDDDRITPYYVEPIQMRNVARVLWNAYRRTCISEPIYTPS